MNELGLKARVDKFEASYGSQLDSGKLEPEGETALRSIIADAGYALVHPVNKEGHAERNTDLVYSRVSDEGVEVLVERKVDTLDSGLNYLKLDTLTDLEVFKQKYAAGVASYCNKSTDDEVGGGVLMGAMSGLVCGIAAALIARYSGSVLTGGEVLAFLAGFPVSFAVTGGLIGHSVGKDNRKKENGTACRKVDSYSVGSFNGMQALKRAVDDEVL